VHPAVGAAVTVLDRTGATVYSGNTGADGWVHGIPVVTTVYHQTTTNAKIITQDARGPFTVQASSGGTTASQSFTLTSDLQLTLTVG
jgi:hypothetical protein